MSTSKEPPLLIPHPPTPLQLQAWLQRHLDLLLAERRAEMAESHLLLSSVSPKVLEANGLALGRLGILNQSVGAGGKRIIELHRPAAFNNESNFAPHSFRTGDFVKIVDEAGDKQAGGSKKKSGKKSDDNGSVEGIDGVVTRVTDTRIYVAVGRSRKKSGSGDEGEDDELPSRCRLVQVANEVTWERMEKNLLRLAQKLEIAVRTSRGIRGGSDSAAVDNGDSSSEDEAKPSTSALSSSSTAPLPAPSPTLPSLPPLLRCLLALDPPSRLPASLPAPPLPLFNQGLNETQRSALSRALVSKQVHLIHGPPGTGKTTVLVELILQLVLGKGERVLVAGSSNLAVDNLAARLVTFRKGRDKDLRPIRIGHPARILSSLQNHTLDYLSTSSDSGRLLTDTRNELQAAYASLHTGTYRAQQEGKPAAGNKSTSKRGTSSGNNKKLTGSERKKVYEEVKALRGELKQRERGLFTETIANANVVLSTLHGASGGVLERSLRTPKGQEKDKKLFDTVIIDEACQSLEASIWGAILDKMEDNGRLILAGDDKQLGPVVKSESTSRRKKERKKKEKPEAKAKKDSGGSDTKELERATEEVTISEEGAVEDAEDDQDSSADEVADDDGPEGDTVSLDPTPSSSADRPTLRPPSSLHKTLFTRLISLYGSSSHLKSLLTVQYRMSSPIMDYPNQALYEDKLVAHESCKDGWLGDGHISSWKGSPSDREEIKGGSVVFYDTAGSEMYESTDAGEPSSSTASSVHSHSICNVHEVQTIQSHLDLLFQSGIPPEAITILAPYSAQISLISSTLSSSLTPEIFTPLEIGTIDSLQGREQEIVILSLVRSNESGEIGFLKEVRRLNVAMTRAKRQLVVIGDSETVRKGGRYLKEWMDWLEEHAIVEPVLP